MATSGPRDTSKAWHCFMGALLTGHLGWGEGSVRGFPGEGTGNLSSLFSHFIPLTCSSVPRAGSGKSFHQCQCLLSDFPRELMNYLRSGPQT